jgi:hypothetical protein
MKSIPCKIIERVEEEVASNGTVTTRTVQINVPTAPLPIGLRYIFNGATSSYEVAENTVDEAKMMVDYPKLKEIVDAQKPVKASSDVDNPK